MGGGYARGRSNPRGGHMHSEGRKEKGTGGQTTGNPQSMYSVTCPSIRLVWRLRKGRRLVVLSQTIVNRDRI